MKLIIETVIVESRDFNTMLLTAERLSEFANPEWVESGARIFYQRFCNAHKSIKEFIKNNIDRLSKVRPLYKVYIKEISQRILRGFDN